MPTIVPLRRQFVNYWLGWVAAFAMLQSVIIIGGLSFPRPWDPMTFIFIVVIELGILTFMLFFFLPIALQRFRIANQYVRLRRAAASKDEQMTQTVGLAEGGAKYPLPISAKVEVKMKNINALYLGLLIFMGVIGLCSVSIAFFLSSTSLPLRENIIMSVALLISWPAAFALLFFPFFRLYVRFSRYIVQATEDGIEVKRRHKHWEIPWHDVRLILQIPPPSFSELLTGGFFRPISSGTFDAIILEYKKLDQLDTCYEIASAKRRILIFIPQSETLAKREGLFGQPIFDDPATYRERMQAIIALAVERTGVQIRAAREPDAPARP